LDVLRKKKIVFVLLSAWVLPMDAPAAISYELDLAAKDIAYSPVTSLLYISVPGIAGDTYFNSVVAISPVNASVLASVPVGSGPGPLGVSIDAEVGYVGLNGAGTIVPIDLSQMATGSPFALGSSPSEGLYHAETIAVMPSAPATVAVSRRNIGYSPRYAGVVVYDSGIARPNSDTAFLGSNVVAFGADPNVLYGSDAEDSDESLYRYTITTPGISGKASANHVLNGANHLIVDGQTIYSSTGATVDGPTFTLLGTYQAGGPLAVDPVNRTVMYVVSASVVVFDRDTYVPLFQVDLPGPGGFPIAAAGCGSACIGVVYPAKVIVVPNVYRIFSDSFDQ
jgi:hypothetical protein